MWKRDRSSYPTCDREPLVEIGSSPRPQFLSFQHLGSQGHRTGLMERELELKQEQESSSSMLSSSFSSQLTPSLQLLPRPQA